MNAYFSFSGRMRRTTVILLVILLVFLQVILYARPVAGAIGSMTATDNPASILGPSLSLYLIFSILFLIMWFALAVKRLHDCGFSGWSSAGHPHSSRVRDAYERQQSLRSGSAQSVCTLGQRAGVAAGGRR